MKELSIYQKGKVIKLFLKGETYDEVAAQVGIAKGSVVNIVDDFRNGYLSLPPGMTEYVDAPGSTFARKSPRNRSVTSSLSRPPWSWLILSPTAASATRKP